MDPPVTQSPIENSGQPNLLDEDGNEIANSTKLSDETSNMKDGSVDPNGNQTSNEQTDGPDQDDTGLESGEESDLSEKLELEDYADWERYVARNPLKHMQKRIKAAPKRLAQHNQYTRDLEKRVAGMEQRWEVYDSERRKGIIQHVNEGQEKPSLHASLNFQYWNTFSDKNLKPEHVIDVLLGDPEIGRSRILLSARSNQNDGSFNPTVKSQEIQAQLEERRDAQSNSVSEKDVQAEKAKLRGKLLPDRIRINSEGLLAVLKAFWLAKMPGFKDPGCILLSPFKPLLQHEIEIVNIITEIEKAVEKLRDGRKTDSPQRAERPTNDKKRGDDLAKSPDAISKEEWERILKDLALYVSDDWTQKLSEDWKTMTGVTSACECLRDLIANYIKPFNTQFRDRARDRVYFRDIWHLFYPGDKILAKKTQADGPNVDAGEMAYVVLRTSGGRRVINPGNPPMPFDSAIPRPLDDLNAPIGGLNPFYVESYYLDSNGTKLIPVRKRFVIAPYSGERAVTELEVYPVNYDPEYKSRTRKLKERGEKFVRLSLSTLPSYGDCKGVELHTKEDLNDKVIVDMKEYFKTHTEDVPKYIEPGGLDVSETSDCDRIYRDCTISNCWHRTFPIIHDQPCDQTGYLEFRDSQAEFRTLSSEVQAGQIPSLDYSICYYRFYAYKLRSREWVQIHVDSLDLSQKKDTSASFRLLVLPDEHKDIIESQVREHFRKRDAYVLHGSTEDDMDLVRGKGQGLIILLHGAPGVGKTATAECIADLERKPLYPITCGDLGSTAEEVENGLKKHFTLASKWDCVMLLDEADVFLAQRRQDDLQRNSIISVFLRMLEYYKGLLFLTTNRVGQFDEAFTSRIHITLWYSDFDWKTTRKVWKTFIARTKQALESNGRGNININGKSILNFARDHWDDGGRWNGRQIRNAFHTAVAMAEFNARGRRLPGDTYDLSKDVRIDINRSQFEAVAKTVREFDDYMNDLRGVSGDFKAESDGNRLKMFRQEVQRATMQAKKGNKASRRSQKEEESTDEDESESSEDEEKEDRKKQKGKGKGKGKGKSKKKEKAIREEPEDDDEDSEEDE